MGDVERITMDIRNKRDLRRGVESNLRDANARLSRAKDELRDADRSQDAYVLQRAAKEAIRAAQDDIRSSERTLSELDTVIDNLERELRSRS